MLLALDTATRQAGLALYDGQMVRAESTWHAGRYHTEWLTSAIQHTLTRIKASMQDISAVAVTIGPGSFTGLRVAISLAKGIAAARELPIIGIETLDVTAYSHISPHVTVCATLAAGRNRHAYSFYDNQDKQDTQSTFTSTSVNVAYLADLLNLISEHETERPLLIVGEFSADERQQLADRFSAPTAIQIVPPALSVRRPAVLAELAWQRLLKQDVDNLQTLEPIYLNVPKAKRA